MVRSILLSMSVLVGVTHPLLTFAAPPQVVIDRPESGKVLSGIVTIYGWALGETHPIAEVKAYVDGDTSGGTLGFGGARGDVGAAYPSVPNSARSGFALAFNTREVSNGPHTLHVRAENTNGESTTKSVPFIVSNAPGDDNPTTVQLNLTGATVKVVNPTSLLVEGVTINGQKLTTLLQFDTNSNQFVMSSFADDKNRDGFQDDDLNHDGFSDDDLNHDGFDDDDQDGNGQTDSETEVIFASTGADADASGSARLRTRPDRTEFNVEVEDLNVGSYNLLVGGALVSSIQVATVAGGTEGEVEFRNPVEPGKILLNFDPRGKLIQVTQGSTVFLQVTFP